MSPTILEIFVPTVWNPDFTSCPITIPEPDIVIPVISLVPKSPTGAARSPVVVFTTGMNLSLIHI